MDKCEPCMSCKDKYGDELPNGDPNPCKKESMERVQAFFNVLLQPFPAQKEATDEK